MYWKNNERKTDKTNFLYARWRNPSVTRVMEMRLDIVTRVIRQCCRQSGESASVSYEFNQGGNWAHSRFTRPELYRFYLVIFEVLEPCFRPRCKTGHLARWHFTFLSPSACWVNRLSQQPAVGSFCRFKSWVAKNNRQSKYLEGKTHRLLPTFNHQIFSQKVNKASLEREFSAACLHGSSLSLVFFFFFSSSGVEIVLRGLLNNTQRRFLSKYFLKLRFIKPLHAEPEGLQIYKKKKPI